MQSTAMTVTDIKQFSFCSAYKSGLEDWQNGKDDESPDMVAHDFNPITWKAESRRCH